MHKIFVIQLKSNISLKSVKRDKKEVIPAISVCISLPIFYPSSFYCEALNTYAL